MPEQKYAYANIAIGNDKGGITFFVIRLWRDRLDKPDLICEARSVTNTELISDALNLSIGLTRDQAGELLNEWTEDITSD